MRSKRATSSTALISKIVTLSVCIVLSSKTSMSHVTDTLSVLYHQPDKMVKSSQDLAARKDNLEQLKQQHGIE